MIDVPLPHLDHPFDYVVPADLDDVVVSGSRVRVRFAARLVDGFVLERREASDHGGRLSYVERAVGAAPVLTAETTRLFRAVADRWAGTFVDVVRLGVPARHVGAESASAVPTNAVPEPADAVASGLAGWRRYRAGEAFLRALAIGHAARAVWTAAPGEQWPSRLADLAAVALGAGRGVVVVVPDARDLARLDAAFHAGLGADQHVLLSADLGPAERYRRWLAVRRGTVRAVIGTRAAAFAPVGRLGLVAIWDDGDDLYDEPRAPYPHTRDVLALRSSLADCALLVGGFGRSCEAQQLLETGWAREITARREVVRAAAPRVTATGDVEEVARDPAARIARLPSLAFRAARESLAAGHPVLVQVPRRGYAPVVACVRDRTPARCPSCAGPLAFATTAAIPTCRWCGRPAADWTCPKCGRHQVQAVVVGSARTAEELGRAFPGVTVKTSGGPAVLSDIADRPALIVATPGAEPAAAGGYGAALLLDGWALLGRADLRAGEETLRRWANAAALVRAGGPVIVGADAATPAVQALIRWDTSGFAARELADRQQLRFPPAVRMAALEGEFDAIDALLDLSQLPEPHDRIGPVTVGEHQRVLLRVPRSAGAELAAALKAAVAIRSARKAEPVKVMLDPYQL
jgi:primosomal protein N' (replication factor Y) (superfamily II helicase)